MTRYESADGFWEITLAGKWITITSGALGTTGKTTVKKFASEAAATAACDELVVAKTKGRFALVAAKPIVVARHFVLDGKRWEITLDGMTVRSGSSKPKLDQYPTTSEALDKYNQAIAGKLAAGYVECGAGDTVGDARNPELEAAIARDPDDPVAYSVLADWLQDRGDPRGELIALQLANKWRRVPGYLDEHASYLLGPLAEHVKCYDELYSKPTRDAFTWKYGFIHAARMSYMEVWNTRFKGRIAQVLELLLDHPSGRFLTELALMYNTDVADHDQQELIDVLAKRAPKTLRKLVIGDDVDQISWYRIGRLGKLWRAVPGLVELAIEGCEFTLGTVELPALRRAMFKTGGLGAEAGMAIATAHWPRLEHLDVYYGDDQYGGECSMKQVQPLLDRTDLPALVHLGVKDAMFADEICVALPNARILPQLRTLDLSRGMMTDEGARVLAARAEAFAHLEQLDVSDNYLTKAGINAIKRIAKRVNTDIQKDDDGDPENRYVSIGE